MATFAEITTAVVAMASVVGISVGATVYFGEGESTSNEVPEITEIGPHRYVISDAYYACRDELDERLSQEVRNIHVDSHSSRYDTSRNLNEVYIELDLIDRNGGGAESTESAKILCTVSAASNEIRSFDISK